MGQLRAGREPARETSRQAHGDGTTRQPSPAKQHDAAHQVLKVAHLWGTKTQYSRVCVPLKSRPIPRPGLCRSLYAHTASVFTRFLGRNRVLILVLVL